jgi:hypothetical protein
LGGWFSGRAVRDLIIGLGSAVRRRFDESLPAGRTKNAFRSLTPIALSDTQAESAL